MSETTEGTPPELSPNAPIVRDETWIDAFEAQATSALYAKATRYASAAPRRS